MRRLKGILPMLLTALVASDARPAEPYLPLEEIGPLEKVERVENGVFLHARRAAVRITFPTESIVRVFMDPYRRFEDRSSARSIMDRTKYQAAVPVEIQETDSALTMTSGQLRVTVLKGDTLGLVFKGPNGEVLTRMAKPLLTASLHGDYHRMRFQIAPDEQFYGLGERFFSLNHRGREITLRNVDVINQSRDYNYFSIPFFISSRGYGIFYNNTWETKFRLGSEDPEELSIESPGPNCDLYFINGPTPRDVLKNYMYLTGLPPLIPRYALGLWLGDFPYENQDRIPRIGQEFIDHELPWDNFYLDYEWANTFFDFQFSPATTPHPEDLVAWFRHHRRQLALIETPFINAECPLYEEVLGRRYFCDPLSAWWHTERGSGQMDFSNPEAARWWWQLHQPLVDLGISFFVTDDGEFTREKALTSDGVGGGELRNYYSLLYARALFEEMEKSSNQRGFISSRSGFAGSQKFGSFFAGDQDTHYDNVLKVTRAVLSSGLSGVPFLRTDLAGLFGGLDPDRYLRFIESQALHPMLMLFTYIPSNVPSNKYAGKLDRRPWTYGHQCLAGFRKYLQLRQSLVPYLYTLAAEAHSTGTPMMRPLFFEFPKDSRCWAVEDEYLVGAQLLVAPIMSKDTFEREIYLPAGNDWVDFWSDRVYAGGQTIRYAAPIDVLPLFARRGAVLPFQDPMLTLVDHPYPDLTWRVYASSRNAQFELYEDDGITQDYKQGKVLRTVVAWMAGPGMEIQIRAGSAPQRRHIFEIHLLERRPLRVFVAGEGIRVKMPKTGCVVSGKPAACWDGSKKVLLISLPRLPGEETSIQLK